VNIIRIIFGILIIAGGIFVLTLVDQTPADLDEPWKSFAISLGTAGIWLGVALIILGIFVVVWGIFRT